MADEVDVTEARESALLEQRIARVRERAAVPVVYPADCKWCKGPTGGVSLFCSAECRDDHQQHQRFQGVAP